jgi:hypothetical protein
MDIPEFLEKLRGVKDKYVWKIVDKWLIRAFIKNKYNYSNLTWDCPITALYKKDIMSVYQVGRSLGLSIEDISRIIQASDGLYCNYLEIEQLKQLRQQILDILELKEVHHGYAGIS